MFRAMGSVLVVGGMVLSAADRGHAEWIAVRQMDEFDQKHRFFATTSPYAPSLSFICEAETGRLKLLYKSSTKSTRGLRRSLPRWPVWAYVIIDDDAVRSYPGKMTEIEKMIVFGSYDDGAVALSKIIASAQRRVLIAIDDYGEKSFRQEFAVAGSAKPIALVTQECAKYRR